MWKGASSQRRCWVKIILASVLEVLLLLSVIMVNAPTMLPALRAQVGPKAEALVSSAHPQGTVRTYSAIDPGGNITYPFLIGSSGNIEIDIPKSGIAVRVEIPREFLQGVVLPGVENDTHFVTSNIRNDYYYYSLVDESQHWTYDWHNKVSDGPGFKPNFSYYDNNAPYSLEIWNYLNSPTLKQPDGTILCFPPGTWWYDPSQWDKATPCASNYFDHTLFPTHIFNYTYLVGVNYCQAPNLDVFVFNCFSSSPTPKFVLLHGLSSPSVAGVYDFTIYVADRTNILGYPDFVHTSPIHLFVPVSMAYNSGYIAGNVCDAGTGQAFVEGLNCNGPIAGKGVVYACPATAACSAANIVARAYVNQTLCVAGVNCGRFNLTGLAPGNYFVEGSAGIDPITGLAFSLTPYGYGLPNLIPVNVAPPPNGGSSIQLPLRRAPVACGLINYYFNGNGPVPSLGTTAAGNPYLLEAGYAALDVTVEAADSSGHVFRFGPIPSTDLEGGDPFELSTGAGVHYVGTDPYGTEYAGLPAPEDFPSGQYTLNVSVWVSGYIQPYPETVTISQSPGTTPPGCATPLPTGSFAVSPNPIRMQNGGLIAGTLQFCNTLPTCTPETPDAAQASLPITINLPPDTLFGGNVVVEAFDSNGLLRGVTVIRGTVFTPRYESFTTSYAAANKIHFFITGFSEYRYHSLSGVWHTYPPDAGRDYGLPNSVYTLEVFLRGYELTSTNPNPITITGGSQDVTCINGCSSQDVTVFMTRAGAFEVTVQSADNRFGTGAEVNGTRAVQAQLPWRFLNSSIPVWARVYFYGSSGIVGYVDVLMNTKAANPPGETGASLTNDALSVVFAGQDRSLREILFYGLFPTHVTDDNYTIEAYTLGYVEQFQGGISLQNGLIGFVQGSLTLFYANEVDITVPIFSTPQSLSSITEYDHAIGQVFSGPLFGAEMYNISGDIKPVPTLQFNLFGFGAMELSNLAECSTDVMLEGQMDLCGQGHFFYVAPDGTRYADYGLDVGNYTASLSSGCGESPSYCPPEFGFLVHYLQVLTPPSVSFEDLFLQAGVFLQSIQMAIVYAPIFSIQGFIDSSGAPLSWAQVKATNTTYFNSVSTSDGGFNGVSALFLPAGTYNITITDQQYQPQTIILPVNWGNTYAVQSIYLLPCPLTGC